MEPTERTELRIVFDNANLYYIGVYCYDDVPSRISGNSMVHNGIGEGKADDVVRVLLDPFQDKRNAYVFIVNSRGGRSEGLASSQVFEQVALAAAEENADYFSSFQYHGVGKSIVFRGGGGISCPDSSRVPLFMVLRDSIQKLDGGSRQEI